MKTTQNSSGLGFGMKFAPSFQKMISLAEQDKTINSRGLKRLTKLSERGNDHLEFGLKKVLMDDLYERKGIGSGNVNKHLLTLKSHDTGKEAVVMTSRYNVENLHPGLEQDEEILDFIKKLTPRKVAKLEQKHFYPENQPKTLIQKLKTFAGIKKK